MKDNTKEGRVAAVGERWVESEASRPERPYFLEPDEIRSAREYAGLPADADAELFACAGAVIADSRLVSLMWHTFRSVVVYEEHSRFTQPPAQEHRLGARAGCFFLLVALATIRVTREKHRLMGIPAEVTRQTCRQVACFAGNYRAGTRGELGVFRRQLYWLRNYTDGVIFRIGRFEYRLKRLDFQVHLYRHAETGHVLALAAEGRAYDADGYAAEPGTGAVSRVGTGAKAEPRAAWTASLSETDDAIHGYPVHPAGRAIARAVTLDPESWTCILRPGDTVLDMHIPADGPMQSDVCADSMRRAVAFFARHFPDEPVRGFWCSSWIFGPQLEQILPSSSNLVSFMRRVYLCPGSADPSSLWFIFFSEEVRPETAPRDNTLRRVIAEYLEAGGVWRNAGMVFAIDDLDRLADEPYRSAWPELTRLCGIA